MSWKILGWHRKKLSAPTRRDTPPNPINDRNQPETRPAWEQIPAKQPDVGISFNLVNPKTVEWAKHHAAENLSYLPEETRATIRSLVVAAFTDGTTPRGLASHIVPLLTLTKEEDQRVSSYREELLAKGYRESRLAKAVARFTQKLLRDHASLIASTEILRASNQGQQGLWRDAVASGYLNPSRTWRKWIATADDKGCAICKEMNGDKARLEEPFQTPLGPVMGPPLHNGCRCCTGLAFED